MNQEKLQKIQQQLQRIQRQLLDLTSQLYQYSINGQPYEKIVENIIAAQAQSQTLLWVLNEDQNEDQRAPTQVKEKEEKK